MISAVTFWTNSGALAGTASRMVSVLVTSAGIVDAVDTLDGDFRAANVHLNDLATLAAIGIFDGGLDHFHRFFFGQHAGNLEERRLHDDIDTPTQANRLGDRRYRRSRRTWLSCR